MEKEIIDLIKQKGSLTGSEIKEAIGGDGLVIWQACKLSEKLLTRTLGTRYLRLDRMVDGFARLSPSIFREFLTYSVVGLAGNPDSIEQKVQEVIARIEEVSKSKLDLVYRTVSGVAGRLAGEWPLDRHVCFVIAGDIVFNMAHDVLRPERSTGKMVNGSDMDLIVIVDDKFPEDLMKRLDDYIYQEKYRLLITPSIKEEIDYIVKRLERVREQLHFDTFKHMVACKILHEGTFLYGSADLFSTVKAMLRQSGATEKLNDLEKRAMDFRSNAEEHLLRDDPDNIKEARLHLFYPTEESEEFE